MGRGVINSGYSHGTGILVGRPLWVLPDRPLKGDFQKHTERTPIIVVDFNNIGTGLLVRIVLYKVI